MGEYAEFRGKEVKIGTCENMYYLRASHAHMVKVLPGNVDPNDIEQQRHIRFRFPWPDEDGTAKPGHDTDDHRYERDVGVTVSLESAKHATHYSVQFVAHCGLLLNIPCPLGPGPHPIDPTKIHKNGWTGDYRITQQAWRDNDDGRGVVLTTVVKCGGCGGAFRLSFADAVAVAEAIMKDGDSRVHQEWVSSGFPAEKPLFAGEWHYEVARRILAGYEQKQAVEAHP